MEHGGIILDYSCEQKLIDFSSNINPFGYPVSVEQAIMENLGSLKVYPDLRHRQVISNVSSYLKVDSDFVSVGNGSIELLDSVILNFDKIILFEPCFSEYEIRSEAHDKEIGRYFFDDNHQPDIESIRLNEKTLLIIGNPNNPTGRRIKRGRLAQIYGKVVSSGAHLLLDEAFFEFCPQDYDSISLFLDDGYKHVTILRAATKFFGLPGLRFGYAVASKEMTNKIRKRQISWTLNAFVAPISEVIFQDQDFIKKSKLFMSEERFFLKNAYQNISAFRFFETQANFYLLECLSHSSEQVFEFLLCRYILARKTTNFNGLKGEFLRFAIRSHEENLFLIEQLKKMDGV